MYRRGFVDGEYQDGSIRGLSFLAGKRGMGKTTEMDNLLNSCSGPRIFFDTLSKHHDIIRHTHLVSDLAELKNAIRSAHRSPFKILYQPRFGSLDVHFQNVCLIVLAVAKGENGLVFAVDEIDKLCGVRFGESRMCGGLYDLVNYGRHHRVALLGTSRRPAQVPRGFTSECFDMRVFRVTEPNSLDYFKEYSVDLLKARALEKYQYLYWQDGCESVELRGGRRQNL